MHQNTFGDLIADTENRVKRRHRLLKNHGDNTAAHLTHAGARSLNEILIFQQDCPAGYFPGWTWNQPHNGKRGHTLSATGFTYNSEDFTTFQLY